MAMPSSLGIVYGSEAVSADMNDKLSQLYAISETISAKTAASWLLGPTHSFVGTTIQNALDENYSAIAAGLTVGSGTTAKSWTIYQGFAGSPTDTLTLNFERGTSTNASVRFNETTDRMEINEGGGWSKLAPQPFDCIYPASLFNPHKHTSTSTTVTLTPTWDATYMFEAVNAKSAQTTLNYYAFNLTVKLPQEFGDWKSSTAAALYFRTQTVASSQNHVDVSVRHKAGILNVPTSCASATKTAQVSTGSGTWKVITWTKANLTGGSVAWAAGDLVSFDAKLETKSSKYAALGPLLLLGERT